MHICHINLAGGYRGGERQTELLIRALSAKGVRQTIIGRLGSDLLPRLQEVADLDCIEVGSPYYFRWQALRGDLVHAHENKGAHVAHIGRVLGGRPYLITRRIAKQPGGSWFTHDMYRRAARVVGVCEAVSQVISAYEPAAEVETIYSVATPLEVNPSEVAAIRQRFAGRRVVLNVAALAMGQKGQQYLLEAAAQLSAQHADLSFVFCGDGPDAEALREQAAGQNNILFAGFVDNVGDYLATADIFVLPSLWEGLGTIALDAMGMGLPVVASAVDGVPEIVQHEKTGLLVPPANANALVEAIDRLLNAPELSARFGASGKKLAQGFRPELMAERYLSFYKDALSDFGDMQAA